MKYMGSKSRHVKWILPHILSHSPARYVEPFVGGANVICKVDVVDRIGNDTNSFVIAMFKAIQKGWLPPKIITNDEYLCVRDFPEKYPPELVGFVGIGCSYSGKWWGGYARGEGRNYCRESRDNLLQQKEGLHGVEFMSRDYHDVPLRRGATVYCDPPYRGTTGYASRFDSDAFWEWCDEVSRRCWIYVSEYSAPPNWVCVWERQVHSSLTKDTGSHTGIEKLFIPAHQQCRWLRFGSSIQIKWQCRRK